MALQNGLDKFWEQMKDFRDRLCIGGEPESIELHRDDLYFVGRQSVNAMFDSRPDIFPPGTGGIVNGQDCQFIGQRIFEQLFERRVAIHESTSPAMKRHIKAYYSDGKEWNCVW